MLSVRRAAAVLLLPIALAACTEGSASDAGSPGVSAPPTPSAVAQGVQPDALLLTSQQLTGYTRKPAQVVTAQSLVSANNNDQSLLAQLSNEGFQNGAMVEYDINTKGVLTAFDGVQSQVLFFRSPAGATAYYTAELQRRTDISGGATQPIGGVPMGDTDQISVISQVQQVDASQGGGVQNGWFAIMRRGDIVATVFAGGEAERATQVEFLSLVVYQESDLIKIPKPL